MPFHPDLADHLLFVFFGVLFPLNAVLRSQPLLKTLGEWDTAMKIAFFRSNGLLLWGMAAVVVFVWLWNGRPPADLGFRLPLPGSWTNSLLISLVFLIGYGVDVWREMATPAARERTRAQWRERAPFLPANRRELRAFHWLALSAAVGEEVLFRGFFILYLLSWFGAGPAGQAAAIILPTVIFALGHFYQGWEAVGKIAVLSLAFGLLFLVSGSLLIPIVLHLVVDVMGGWLSYWIAPLDPPSGEG